MATKASTTTDWFDLIEAEDGDAPRNKNIRTRETGYCHECDHKGGVLFRVRTADQTTLKLCLICYDRRWQQNKAYEYASSKIV
jgi:hypothetical protein